MPAVSISNQQSRQRRGSPLAAAISNRFGFTLIELLIVISIIGILATIVIGSFRKSQGQARDAVRKSDLNQYRSLLENFANGNNGFYPSRTASAGADASTVLCGDLNSFFNPDVGCPTDPSGGSAIYRYQSDGGSSGAVDATSYVLWATFQAETNIYWVACSTGLSGKIASSTTFSSGGCPSGLVP